MVHHHFQVQETSPKNCGSHPFVFTKHCRPVDTFKSEKFPEVTVVRPILSFLVEQWLTVHRRWLRYQFSSFGGMETYHHFQDCTEGDYLSQRRNDDPPIHSSLGGVPEEWRPSLLSGLRVESEETSGVPVLWYNIELFPPSTPGDENRKNLSPPPSHHKKGTTNRRHPTNINFSKDRMTQRRKE